MNVEANSGMTHGLSVFSGSGKLLWCSYDPKTDSAGHRGWRTEGNEVSIDDLVSNVVGRAAHGGLCCFVHCCLISSPLFFFLFSLPSTVMSDDSIDIHIQVVLFGFFFLDNNWKLFLDFFLQCPESPSCTYCKINACCRSEPRFALYSPFVWFSRK